MGRRVWKLPSRRILADAKQVAGKPGHYRLTVTLDDLDLPKDSLTLGFEARVQGIGDRDSRVLSDLVMLQVEKEATVVQVKTVERTVMKFVPESKTRMIQVMTPEGLEERTTVYTVAIPRMETRSVQRAEIAAGEYARLFASPAMMPEGDDVEDANIEAELERVRNIQVVDRKRTQTVYYATNREVVDPQEDSVDRFGAERGETMHYGSASVRIPMTHFFGDEIDTPFWSWFDNPKKHFRVQTLTEMQKEPFFTLMHSALAADAEAEHATENDVLLFVHGYNTSMRFSLLRLGQLAFDLGFEGRACAFVWPSDGKLFSYGDDLEDAQASIDDLTDLLDRLAKADSPGRVHVIAHSMGNHVFLQALDRVTQRWANAGDAEGKRLGHVVLAAPDVWVNEFQQWAPGLIQRAKSVTHYHCTRDRPLQASIAYHDLKIRAGLFAQMMLGIDNVNCDDVNLDFIGHSAFAEESPVLFDLQLLLQRDLPPYGRSTLESLGQGMPSYELWRARADLAPERPIN